MASKIIFGSDLIDVLENKYNMNKLGEVPTKYKNGITIIDFIYGKEKDIDDLKYNKPYVEFSINDETDRFISGTMYLNGVESVQLDSWEDLKYFVKNAKWTESRKSLKESNQITANIWEWQRLLNGVCNFTNWITRTFVKGETLHKALEKIYRNEEITLDEFVNACIDYIGDYQFEEKINEYVKQYLSTNDKIKNAFKTKGIKVVESKKSVRKSLKEGIDVKIVYADDTPSEYIDDVTRSDILDIIEESPEVYKIFDVSGSKKKLVWSDEYGFERAYESKKSVRKSIKEGINDELIATSSDGETTLYLSDERQANHGKDPHYEFKLGENGYFTRYVRCDDNRCENIVLDWIKEFDLDISKSEISKIIKLHESKKSVKKSLKESKDSDFFNGIAKEYHFSKDEKTRYKDKTYISAIAVLFDRINNAIKIYGRNSDEEYNALNDCWSVITSAKQNGWNVDYEEDKWNKIAGLPNYH